MSKLNADRLREVRSSAGFASAAAAARAHGWNEATYRHHENGTRGFDLEAAEKYAVAFKVDTAWLYGLRKEPRDDLVSYLQSQLGRFDGFSGTVGEIEQVMQSLLGLSLVRRFSFGLLRQGGVSALLNQYSGHLAFSTSLLENLCRRSAFDIIAVEVEDNQMSPTLQRGAIVLVDTEVREPDQHDGIWLFTLSGLAELRFLRYRTQYDVQAWNEREKGHLEFDSREEGFAILGKAVWSGQPL